ncbi:hypothetical protein FF2_039854 [Malus domestica]
MSQPPGKISLAGGARAVVMGLGEKDLEVEASMVLSQVGPPASVVLEGVGPLESPLRLSLRCHSTPFNSITSYGRFRNF